VITVKGDVEEYERAHQAAVGAKPPAAHAACYSITKTGGKQVSVVFVGWDPVEVCSVVAARWTGTLRIVPGTSELGR